MSALAGFGDGQVNATISGLSLPGETFARCKTVENRRASGVPAQTVNSGAVLQRWLAAAGGAERALPRKRCRANCCSAVNHR